MRWFLLVAGIAFAAILAEPAYGASRHTYVTDCSKLRYKPASIVLTCADANYGLEKMHWTSWTRRAAYGKGYVYANDCNPFCLGGHFHSYRVRVLLSGSLSCRDRRIFRRARIHYLGAHPARTPRVDHWSFGCFK